MTSETNVDDVPNYKSFYLRNYTAQEGHKFVTSILDYFIFLKGETGLNDIAMQCVCVPYRLRSYLIGFHEICYGHCIVGNHPNPSLLNLLQSLITCRTHEIVRWERR
jgi:hypothetical protein